MIAEERLGVKKTKGLAKIIYLLEATSTITWQYK